MITFSFLITFILGSQSKTNKGQHENSDASKDINVMESNKDVQLQNISEPVVRMQTGTSIVEGESFKSKQAILDDIKNSPHKKESVPIPLDSDSPDKKLVLVKQFFSFI